MLTVFFLGFLAGAVHTLSGPDHLAALAPFASSGRREAWALGTRWGLGHAAGVVLVGLFALALRGLLPLDALSAAGEHAIGALLIGVGLLGGYRALRDRVHAHRHRHGGNEHEHAHAHGGPTHRHTHVAFAVGVLHGFAGGSHLIGIVPALALSWVGAASYLVGFAAGTIGTMVAFVAAISLTARAMKASQQILVVASAAAIVIGLYKL